VSSAAPGSAYPKVLHLIANLEMGGTEGQLVQFASRSTMPERHHVACFYSIGDLASEFPTEPIWLGKIGRRPADAFRNLGVLRKLRATIVDGTFDLVHAHLGLSEVMAAMVTPRRVPIVASRRGRNQGFERNRVLKLIEGMGHRRVEVLVCNSEYLAALTSREDRWPPPTRVIHNAVDLERFARVPYPAKVEPTIAVVANLHPYKGHALLVRALSFVRAQLPAVRLVVVGEGVARQGIRTLAAELGLTDAVTFVGAVADPAPYVADAHVVALTSDHEGFPNALLEAMAVGRPVVATNVGGIPELVRDGVDGFLTSADPAEIAARLAEVLGDPSLGERMGHSAHERAATFTWERVVRETEDVYRGVLARRAAAPYAAGDGRISR
jgi:glycosyltransferase involved in cell wall biosynthesis